jgi:hypothetical protein
MSTICWWLAGVVSWFLKPDEREAVRGDLAESGLSGAQALRDLLGLVLRRQAALWTHWQPWLALLGVVLVAAGRLRVLAVQLDVALSLQLSAYLHYGTYFSNGLTLSEEIIRMSSLSLAMFAWSWMCGFALASLSGRATWLTGTLFVLLFLSRSSFFLFIDVLAFNVLLPALWGASQGLRKPILRPRFAMLLAMAIAVLTTLVTWTSGWLGTAHETWSKGAWRGGVPLWQARLLPLLVLSWPVVYLVATACSQNHRPNKTISASGGLVEQDH